MICILYYTNILWGAIPPHPHRGSAPTTPWGLCPYNPALGEGRTQEAEALCAWSVFDGFMGFT